MDLMQTWEKIDSRVDWYLTGIISLVVLNVLVPLYVGWSYMNMQSFHEKYNIQESDIFVEKAKMLEDIPAMADIEIEPPVGQKPLPDRYQTLASTDMFLPPGAMEVGVPEEGAGDTAPGDGEEEVEPRQPPITGYEIVGRITGKGDLKASVVRATSGSSEDGGSEATGESTYIAREGDYLGNSDVKVVTISDTNVQLSKPGHRVTSFQFEIDEISKKIRQSVTLQ